MNRQIVFSTLILGLLFCLGITALFSKKSVSEMENRSLSTVPSVTKLADMGYSDYEKALETGLSDQWPLRTSLVELSVLVRRALLSDEVNGVYIGKDGYYLEAIKESDFNYDRLERNLKSISDYCEGLGLPLKALLVPTAGTILKDKLPHGATIYESGKAYRLAREYLADSLIDVRNTLSVASDEGRQIYYRTDHHYTTYGAYLCMKELTGSEEEYRYNMVSDDFLGTLYSKAILPGAKKDTIEAVKISDDVVAYNGLPDGDKNILEIYQADKLSGKDKYTYFFGGNPGLVTIEGTGKGNLLIIKDSFANCLTPQLTDKYKKIIMVDLRYYSGSMIDLAKSQRIEEIFLIYEMSNFAEDQNMFKLAK